MPSASDADPPAGTNTGLDATEQHVLAGGTQSMHWGIIAGPAVAEVVATSVARELCGSEVADGVQVQQAMLCRLMSVRP